MGHLTHFLSPSPKSKKKPPRKNIIIFQEMEHSSSCIENFLIIYYISGIGNPKKFFIFQETETLKSLFIYKKM